MEDVAGVPRRTVLRSLVAVGAGLELVQATPAVAPAHVHGSGSMVDAAAEAKKPPVYFSAGEYGTLCALCQLIIPATAEAGGAMEGGVPAFIDLLTSENREYQRRLSGGLAWLDAICVGRSGGPFLRCSEAEQRSVLDAIAYRANGERDSTLVPGVDFFAFLRSLVLDGYFTSKVGIGYLEFRGMGRWRGFRGVRSRWDSISERTV